MTDPVSKTLKRLPMLMENFQGEDKEDMFMFLTIRSVRDQGDPMWLRLQDASGDELVDGAKRWRRMWKEDAAFREAKSSFLSKGTLQHQWKEVAVRRGWSAQRFCDAKGLDANRFSLWLNKSADDLYREIDQAVMEWLTVFL